MRRSIAILLLAAGILLLLGTVTLYSSTTWQPGLQRLYLHLCWLAAGGACCALAASVPYSRLRQFHAPQWLLALACFLLAATLVPGIGVARNGALRWLPFGQPSEFAKLALIVFLADYCTTNQARMHQRTAGFLCPGLLAGLVGLLVFVEPDWGTTTLLAAVALAMLAVAGSHWGYLLSAGIIGAELFASLLLRNALRMERLLAFLDPERYKEGVGWQGWHSLLALGSGGWFGCFFGEGSHKNGFVPEQQTDFVLSLIGEELGLVGTALVLLLFVILLLCGARIAWRIADPFGQLLAFGILLLISLQALINVGVVTSSLPNKGIALPFVSYGGSSMVCMLTGLGLLINVARYGPVRADEKAGNPFGTRTRAKVGGPVGSLLYRSARSGAGGLRRMINRWMRARRNSRFPSVPVHPYQRPPRRVGDRRSAHPLGRWSNRPGRVTLTPGE